MWQELTGQDQGSTEEMMGCVTLLHFIRDKPAQELERILGFQDGGLKRGAYVWRINTDPAQLTITSYGTTRTSMTELTIRNLDTDKWEPCPELRNASYCFSSRVFDHAIGNLKRAWTRDGDFSLVKVVPEGRGDAYPNALAGEAVPQYDVASKAMATKHWRVNGY